VELVVLGFGLGLAVAMQPGPMSVWLLRSTLAGGAVIGIAIGSGIALVDTAYAGLGAAGAGAVLAIDGVRTIAGLAGAATLVVLGVLVLRSVRGIDVDAPGRDRATSPSRALGISIVATAANPTTIASWAAIFAAAGVAASVDEFTEAARLVVGVGAGSASWFALLVTLAATTGRRIGRRALQAIDVASGTALVAFGIALALRVR
jgi:putative LysE/RhtB family amino acid efflux pump